MALLYQAEIRPTKLELLTAWLPSRPWYGGPAGAEVTRVAACRFDDPAGEVGIETMLVRAGSGLTYHTPLTYRGAPLAGGDAWLVGTTEHSVLGKRWVYDACGDPVYAAALASAILGRTGQAEEFVDVDGELKRREPGMLVTGSGDGRADVPAVTAIDRVMDGNPTLISTDSVELSVVRIVDTDSFPAGANLTGTWTGQPSPALLAHLG
jgi:Maltokinase N-terminal cap domain